VVVLSPHLDDSALSCGGLIASLRGSRPVVVVNCFTEGGPLPTTRAARGFLKYLGWTGTPEALFVARRQEDDEALTGQGATVVNLGLTDALFRRRRCGRLATAIGAVVPEVVHLYPTFRFGIGRRWTAPSDRILQRDLADRLVELVAWLEPALVVGPLGVGRHVDHVIVRAATVAAADALPSVAAAFYSDMPYALTHAPDPAFMSNHRLVERVWPDGIADKVKLIAGYRTQAGVLYGDAVPAEPDRIWWPASVDVEGVVAGLRRADRRQH
jgi:LmbE family N-acetylglucosaminyl deacetylase